MIQRITPTNPRMDRIRKLPNRGFLTKSLAPWARVALRRIWNPSVDAPSPPVETSRTNPIGPTVLIDPTVEDPRRDAASRATSTIHRRVRVWTVAEVVTAAAVGIPTDPLGPTSPKCRSKAVVWPMTCYDLKCSWPWSDRMITTPAPQFLVRRPVWLPGPVARAARRHGARLLLRAATRSQFRHHPASWESFLPTRPIPREQLSRE